MQVWDRMAGKSVEEPEYGKRQLEFLYQTVPGRILLHTVFATGWYANLERIRQSSTGSAKQLLEFCRKYGVSEDIRKYRSFRDFFLRQRDYHTECQETELAAAADARLSCYDIDDNLCLDIKGSRYTIAELLGREDLASWYAGGTCLVYRLAVQDYHRFVYPDSGSVIAKGRIKGQLHTVRPVSGKYRVFARNTREYQVLETDHFGTIVQMEIGALLVGKICNYPAEQFERLQEKGYFDYGGSTIVMLFKRGCLRVDEDIVRHSRQGMESMVRIGEKVGYAETNGDLLQGDVSADTAAAVGIYNFR